MKIEAECSEVQGYPWFHRQFETNPGHVSIKYKKPWIKIQKRKQNKIHIGLVVQVSNTSYLGV